MPCPRWVAEALHVQRTRVDLMGEVAGARWEEDDLVFPNTLGRHLRENQVLVGWHSALAAAGLEGPGKALLRMHELRHSKGTPMADEGEHLVMI